MTQSCPRCGTPNASGRLALCPVCVLAPEADPEPSSLEIPGLHIEDEIARGGMGSVHRARHEGLGRRVAVKVLTPDTAGDPEFRARFEREARTLARLDHPGIVRVHDSGTTATGDAYLVMELVPNGTLRERIPVPVERGLRMALELCDALAHAHDRGIVHRDIKPANVLVTADEKLKLTDFGIARILAADELSLTRSSRVFGTPSYMAPEAATGAAPDPLTDVYSLGVLVHELLTGKLPRDGSSPLLPPSVAATLRRATALDPAARTPSVRALSLEIEAALRRLDSDNAGTSELPVEERTWSGAVALLISVATAVGLYAFVASFTPRVLPTEDALPMIAFGVETLHDGRLFTRARFEIWPVLGAAVSFSAALVAYGLLRRHWRQAGLDHPSPERPLPGARRVFRFGLLLIALFAVRHLLERDPPSLLVAYIPVLGGALELWMLHAFWSAVLEAQRTRRLLRREPLLWVGLLVSLVPPTYHFLLAVGGAAG